MVGFGEGDEIQRLQEENTRLRAQLAALKTTRLLRKKIKFLMGVIVQLMEIGDGDDCALSRHGWTRKGLVKIAHQIVNTKSDGGLPIIEAPKLTL